MRGFFVGLVLAAAVAVPAAAKDRSGYQQIATGSLSGAEQTLNAERAIFPNKPELLLNLAVVYSRTGREAQARAMYNQVLDREAVALDLADGSTASSHDIALRGLSRLGASVASR
jgi:Flp pilus assembly protein TadD